MRTNVCGIRSECGTRGWDRRTPINRAVEFDEFAAILRRVPVDCTVLVQSADNDADTDYMLGVAERHPQIAAVVGIRNMIQDQPDPDWLLRPTSIGGLAVLEQVDVPFDVVSVLPRHLEYVPVLARRHPGLQMVIDRLSKPPRCSPAGTTRCGRHCRWSSTR